MNYSLLAWGANCHNIELLQKRAIRVINFKSPLAHTEPILKGMDQLKLPDMYTCHLIKLYYKLYRNKLSINFENFIPEYGESQHDLPHDNIRLPAIKCGYERINIKYQMDYRLRKLANSSRPQLYTQLFTLMGIHYLNLLLHFPYTSSLNIYHLIHFTVILMHATHVNIHDREVKSNMPYFGVYNRMFVHFHIIHLVV